MFFRKSRLIRELREEIQRLREALANVLGQRDAFREQAREAIRLAHEKHFPKQPVILNRDNSEAVRGFEDFISRSLYGPDYVPPEVKNCPECSVSVRAESWPQECPACHCTFGFEEK